MLVGLSVLTELLASLRTAQYMRREGRDSAQQTHQRPSDEGGGGLEYGSVS